MHLQDLIDAKEMLEDARENLEETKAELGYLGHDYFFHPDYQRVLERVSRWRKEVERLSAMPLEC